jgi:hypothetical protein
MDLFTLPYLFFILLFYLSFFNANAYSQTQYPLASKIPALADLNNPSLTPKHVQLGGQNFTWCCLLAVSDSYTVQSDGSVVENPVSYTGLSFDAFNASQFACTATYNGINNAAPAVTVPYSWCKSNCGGWQRSHDNDLTQWIQPFVGFILPAAVFCLNVKS